MYIDVYLMTFLMVQWMKTLQPEMRISVICVGFGMLPNFFSHCYIKSEISNLCIEINYRAKNLVRFSISIFKREYFRFLSEHWNKVKIYFQLKIFTKLFRIFKLFINVILKQCVLGKYQVTWKQMFYDSLIIF